MSVGDDTTETDTEWQFSEWPESGTAGGGLLSQILEAVREARGDTQALRAETQALRTELAATNERIDQAVAQLTAQIDSLVADDPTDDVGKLSSELAELRRILIGA